MDNVFDKTSLINNFDRAASTYDKFADVQKIILEELLDQINYLSIQPKTILDLGSGTGAASRPLKKRFPKASIVQSDISYAMLRRAYTKQRWKINKDRFIQADMRALPFKENSFDLVFSSLCLQWSVNFSTVFQQIETLLKPGGALVFSTLGTNSMQEFKFAWEGIKSIEGHPFFDIQQYGNALVAAGFDDPVLNADTIVMNYENIKAAVASVKKVGASNVNKLRNKNITSKHAWEQFEHNYEKLRDKGKLPLTYEPIYGLAWKKNKLANNEKNFPIKEIKKHVR